MHATRSPPSRTRLTYPLVLLLVLVLPAASPFSAPAEASTPIAFGDCVQADIAVSDEVDEYTFSATIGSVVSVRMADPSSGDVWPWIRVYGPDGALLGWAFGGSEAELDTLRAGGSGTHTILAGDWYGDNTGEYGLHLQCTSAPGQATALAYGDCVSSSVDGLACRSTYTFMAEAGDGLTIWMQGAGAVWPEIRLYGSDGALVEWTHSSPDSRLHVYELAVPGMHSVLAGDWYGYHTGGYSLCLVVPVTSIPDTPPSDDDGRITGVWASPNPTATKTAFSVRLNRQSEVRLRVYSIAGRLIFERQASFGPGTHAIEWDPAALACGTYFFTAEVDTLVRRGSIVLVR